MLFPNAQEVVAEFARNGLDREFWKICESRFGYQDSRPTLLKFTLSLFAVYTCREDFALLPKAWETYAPDTMRRKTSNISVLLENMMNNVLYQECFDEISLMASGELQAERALNRFPREELLHMNSFAVIDDLLISWMIYRELAEDKNAAVSGMSIPDICQERLRRHFGSGKKAEYAALLAGYSLLQATDFMPKETLQELITGLTRNTGNSLRHWMPWRIRRLLSNWRTWFKTYTVRIIWRKSCTNGMPHMRKTDYIIPQSPIPPGNSGNSTGTKWLP